VQAVLPASSLTDLTCAPISGEAEVYAWSPHRSQDRPGPVEIKTRMAGGLVRAAARHVWHVGQLQPSLVFDTTPRHETCGFYRSRVSSYKK
jgi:hypothetical protein